MIQENSINNNDCYVQPTDTPIMQSAQQYVRVEDQSDYLISGNCIMMSSEHFSQPDQQIILTDNEMLELVQQQQQPQQNHDTYYSDYVPEQQQQQQQQQHHHHQICSYFPVDANPLTPEDNSPIDPNMSVLSEASTVEGEINPTDEKFAYLTDLNSDNLMQFSQQSELQEMMIREQLQGRLNHPTLPTLDEHDAGGYNFNLSIPTQHNKAKTSWNYSDDLNKLYIRMNDIFSIDAIYTQRMPIQELRIRIFICFAKEVSEPVLRCQNHISKDNENNDEKRESLLRCENPNAEYCGSSKGKGIKDRYSVAVPLTICGQPNEKTVKHTIALKFTCQNSCIGRKETCIIFLLEGMNGQILSQRLLNVRICSCPKRDKALDEKHIATKRKSDGDVQQPDSKIRKREISPITPPIIKDENSSSDCENSAKQFDIQRTASGGFRLIMELSTKDVALSTIEYAFAKESVNIVSESKEAARSSHNFRKLRRLYNHCAELN